MRQVIGIALAQFLGCTLWFSVNGVSVDLTDAWGLQSSDLGLLTSAVQAGFITGTMGLAVSNLADKFKPSQIFFWASVSGAIANILFAYYAFELSHGLLYRFIVGVCLAGIYPVGMKLIVSWSPNLPGLGLGLVVGMLTLGTASPHLLSSINWSPDWRITLVTCLFPRGVGGITSPTDWGGAVWGPIPSLFPLGCSIPKFSDCAVPCLGLWLFWAHVGALRVLDLSALAGRWRNAARNNEGDFRVVLWSDRYWLLWGCLGWPYESDLG